MQLTRVVAATGSIALCLAFGGAIAGGEAVQKAGVRLSVTGRLTPHALPRQGRAPVAVAIGGRILPTEAGTLPQLRRLAIALNAHGHLEYRGVPSCGRREIESSTSADALAICRRSLVGAGRFSSDIRLPEASPFPSRGRILAFNGRWRGRPAILVHIYGTDPAPTSYVLPFAIRFTRGTYGTVLEAGLPSLMGDWGFVSGLSMTLGRGHAAHGAGAGYLTAGCPAPAGFPSAYFPLVKTTFTFAGGLQLISVLRRSCEAVQ